MPKTYEVFVQSLDDLPEGKEIELTLKDLSPGPRKYDNRVVRAIVSRSADRLKGADTLWVRSWTGVRFPEPWWVQVVSEVGELTPGRPHGESLPMM